ncbi:uncharacterized protein LOC114266211 [Camellia sinensis]|uniref:uncharacterized protein LOC114266211 n=1 Tax=Camellia sinensis TaxID=4442 RepID=UPI001036DD20|nr:uncharacterized protein LOC114266211 [Camellia sinensis]
MVDNIAEKLAKSDAECTFRGVQLHLVLSENAKVFVKTKKVLSIVMKYLFWFLLLVEKLCLKWDNFQSDNCGYLNKRLDYGERESMLDLEVCDIALSHDSNKSVNLSNRASISSKRNSSITHVGQKFEGGVVEFCNALLKFSTDYGFEFIFVKNDKVRVTERQKVVCGMFMIVEDIRDNPLTRPVHVVQDFKLGYGLRVSYRHAWLGVEKANGEIFGDYLMSFDQLRWYVDVAKSCNSRSYIEFECNDDTKRFKRLFVAFHGSTSGFDYCRPLLFLDGTFLKGRFKGNLLAATGKDGNQVFDILNVKGSFQFVLQLLAQRIKITGMNLRHHLCGMFHRLKEKLSTLFGKCAYALTEETFHQCLVELKTEGGSRIEKFLDDIPYDHWSNAYFRGQHFGEMWSNVAESFNSRIQKERHLPITKLIDSVRIELTRKIAKRRELVNKWNGLICNTTI